MPQRSILPMKEDGQMSPTSHSNMLPEAKAKGMERIQ